MILLDLFSGIGGFTLGFQRAGFNIERHYYSEIDKHAIANYRYNFKNSNYVGEVSKIEKGTMERPNVITFGSPCQDFSIAGKRTGLSGERSVLIQEAIRIVTIFRPYFFIWENVKGVFSSNNRADFWAVIQAFANIGGYRLEWQLLNTAWFLPQNRERIYLIGHLAESTGDFRQVFPFRESSRKNDGNQESDETSSVRTLSGGGHSGGNHSSMTLLKMNLKNGFSQNDGGVASTIQSRDYKGYSNQDMDFVQEQSPTRWERTEKGKEERRNNKKNGRDYTPFSDGARELKPTDDDNIGCITNAVNKDTLIQVGDWRDDEGLRIRDDGNCPTIQARAREDGSGQPMIVANTVTPDAYLARGERNRDENGKAVLTSMHDRRIRRLTPIECERLQGFPDNFTEYGNYDGDMRKISDTQRYKMLGNAVTVKVVEEVAKRLLKIYPYFSK